MSACLVGLRTRYDGGSSLNDGLLERLRGRCVVPFCPEQLGGLPTPRPASDIVGGGGEDVLDGAARVMSSGGVDVTGQFLRGAEESVAIAARTGAAEAYLKSGSPSCAAGSYPSGGGTMNGVAAAALGQAGVSLVSVD